MLNKTRSIALHSVRYGESSIIAYLYTLEHGRVSLMVNRAFGKGKSKSVYFQPLNLLDVVFYPSKGHGLGRLKEVSSSSLHSTLQFDNIKRAVALFIGEVIYRTLKEEESNPPLFGFLENAVKILDLLEDGVPNFHLVFLSQYCKYLGFHPNGEYSIETPYFDFKNGSFVTHEPNHPMWFGAENAQLLTKLLKTSFSSCGEIKLNHSQRNAFVEQMLHYYTYHMDSAHGVRSHAILAQVFQ
ncbi:MAG TPA: DNA repair protein RecO [Tenuifilaceae bacterium]|nr:DNA repair protein RecO [Tenuifilaceae bacterium]HPE19290.1 DNA repair protein RecO [Tenuifilaceae bacterium]HPJ46758.1 DNA repair protein RecO [Tenuifilaceae bacterium]HPQ33876.1 DNA repair protein RecO [Tenuifilaceae bacterium]HRX68445.1 DNA repair protein RecO [Tenuifilaceae bacterium]